MTKLNVQKLPKHIAFIIDGNGRWAKKRGFTRLVGHDYGFDNLKKILRYAFDKLNIDTISVYCFSTENWNRPKPEVDHLMDIFRAGLEKDFADVCGKDTKLYISGDKKRFPEDIQNKMENLLEQTKDNKLHKLNLCLNYGSQDEILRAVNTIIEDGITKVDKETFSNYLYTKELPPLDFVIRSSGERRLSNFMLWQVAYTEFYFEKSHWPSFTPKKLEKALIDFQKRDRRYGAIKEKNK